MSAAPPLALAAWAALGLLSGWLYFAALACNVRLLTLARRGALAGLAGLARYLALGLALYAAARHGAAPLLAMAAALPLGRTLMLRAARREAAP